MFGIGKQSLPDRHGRCGLLSCVSFPHPLTLLSWRAVTRRRSLTTPDTTHRHTWERLGSALVQVARAQMNSEQGRAGQQEQLAGLIFAAARHKVLADHTRQPAVAMPSVVSSNDDAVVPTEPASWPEIPMSYLIAAGVLLATILFGGLSMAVQSREAKALVELRRDADRWTFRMAA